MNVHNRNSDETLAEVALPKSLLASLIEQGKIHGDGCLCLNSIAKTTLWQTLLNSSMKS